MRGRRSWPSASWRPAGSASPWRRNRPARPSPPAARPTSCSPSSARGDEFAELPGTQVEIARLAELFDAKVVTTLTRADASEQRLDELRRAGDAEAVPLPAPGHARQGQQRPRLRVGPDADAAGASCRRCASASRTWRAG